MGRAAGGDLFAGLFFEGFFLRFAGEGFFVFFFPAAFFPAAFFGLFFFAFFFALIRGPSRGAANARLRRVQPSGILGGEGGFRNRDAAA